MARSAESKKNRKIQRAKDKMTSWSARGDKCPICKRDFRHGCSHSVKQAKDRLFQDYIKVIAQA